MADEDDIRDEVLLREVDEELKKERYAELWKQYGNYVIGAALAVALGVAGLQGWGAYQTSQREAEGESFVQAMALAQAGRPEEAGAALTALAGDAGAGYATLARLQAAALRAKLGDTGGAVDIYDGIAGDSSAGELYRDLAVLLAVMHQLDSGEPAALAALLEPLTADDNPWRYSALEFTGLLADRAGDRPRAREIFTRLGDDPEAPAGLRARARELLSFLGES
ncbi:MAG: tetratricopeptide repeat protein [Alphaproteobacteria bacterium]